MWSLSMHAARPAKLEPPGDKNWLLQEIRKIELRVDNAILDETTALEITFAEVLCRGNSQALGLYARAH